MATGNSLVINPIEIETEIKNLIFGWPDEFGICTSGTCFIGDNVKRDGIVFNNFFRSCEDEEELKSVKT